jgi:glycosyltransferase involved in cell wall biosynthesis
LDAFLITCSDRPVLRGIQYRSLRATRTLRYRTILSVARRRYRNLFTVDNEQIGYFDGLIVSDVDDPRYTPREVQLLNSPRVAAYVVTAERAARRFESLGVDKPYHVVPQGISLASLAERDVQDVAGRHRRPGEVIIGFTAAWLLSRGDRGGSNSLYNVDHLLDLWDEISSRLPNARLWLIGGASARVRHRCDMRDDIVLFGRLPRETLLSYVANFDIALYPRTEDVGVQAVKVAEYMGAGVPTVSYDFEVTEPLRTTGAGLLVSSAREFADAVEKLAADEGWRRQFAAKARAAGAVLDWDRLADRYQQEILDRYFGGAT